MPIERLSRADLEYTGQAAPATPAPFADCLLTERRGNHASTPEPVFQWHLEPADDRGTKISVHVDIPESEATRLDMQREAIGSSLRRLGQLAAASQLAPTLRASSGDERDLPCEVVECVS
jgi:hypothetical protein